MAITIPTQDISVVGKTVVVTESEITLPTKLMPEVTENSSVDTVVGMKNGAVVQVPVEDLKEQIGVTGGTKTVSFLLGSGASKTFVYSTSPAYRGTIFFSGPVAALRGIYSVYKSSDTSTPSSGAWFYEATNIGFTHASDSLTITNNSSQYTVYGVVMYTGNVIT